MRYWVAKGLGNIVSGDVYDLVIDGVTVATGPLVSLTANGNYLLAYVQMAVGDHTFNVVSHLIPYANMADPYGGGTVPSGYTGVTCAAVVVSAQLYSYITVVSGLALSWATFTSATTSWTAVVPANGATIQGYGVFYSVHNLNSWTEVNVPSGTTVTLTGLDHTKSYDIYVVVLAPASAGVAHTYAGTFRQPSIGGGCRPCRHRILGGSYAAIG